MASHSANATPSRHQRINAVGTSSHSSRSEDSMSVRITPQQPRDGGARTDQVAVNHGSERYHKRNDVLT